jgi:hypothetical protein
MGHDLQPMGRQAPQAEPVPGVDLLATDGVVQDRAAYVLNWLTPFISCADQCLNMFIEAYGLPLDTRLVSYLHLLFRTTDKLAQSKPPDLLDQI